MGITKKQGIFCFFISRSRAYPALYLYIRSTQKIYGRWLYTHNTSGPNPPHRRPTVMARAIRYQIAIEPIAARNWFVIKILCN